MRGGAWGRYRGKSREMLLGEIDIVERRGAIMRANTTVALTPCIALTKI